MKRFIRRLRRNLAERAATTIMGGDESITELFQKAEALDDVLDAYQNLGTAAALAILADLS